MPRIRRGSGGRGRHRGVVDQAPIRVTQHRHVLGRVGGTQPEQPGCGFTSLPGQLAGADRCGRLGQYPGEPVHRVGSRRPTHPRKHRTQVGPEHRHVGQQHGSAGTRDELVAGVDIDAGITIGSWFFHAHSDKC